MSQEKCEIKEGFGESQERGRRKWLPTHSGKNGYSLNLKGKNIALEGKKHREWKNEREGCG